MCWKKNWVPHSSIGKAPFALWDSLVGLVLESELGQQNKALTSWSGVLCISHKLANIPSPRESYWGNNLRSGVKNPTLYLSLPS